jgi:uncharacterized protein (TIGR02246 family)
MKSISPKELMMSDHDETEAQMRSLHEGLLQSWNRRDAKGFASLFTKQGNLIGFDGSHVDSPEGIEAHLTGIFADHQPATYVAKVREVRLLSADTAVLRAVAGMVPPGQNMLNPSLNAVQTLVAAKQDGRWRVEVYQNTPTAFHGQPELVKALRSELSELVESG